MPVVILRQKCTAGIMDILDNPTPEAKKTFIHSGILLFICWLLTFIGLQTQKKILYWSMNQSVGHSELKTESPVFPSTLFYIFEPLSSDYLCQQMRRFRNTNTQIYFPYEY